MKIEFTFNEKEKIIDNIIETINDNLVDCFNNWDFYYNLDQEIDLKILSKKIVKEVNSMFTPDIIKNISKKQFERIVEQFNK